MDGPSLPSSGYTLPGVTPTDVKPPAQRSSDSAVTGEPVTPPTPPTPPAPLPTAAPGFSIAFPPGMSGQYVLDCRDPKTNAVLVQVPMRSALRQMEGAATPEQVGKNVDTTV